MTPVQPLARPVPLGAIPPPIGEPPPVTPGGTPPMSIEYAPVRVPYPNTVPVGVAFVETSTRDDGSEGDARYYDHAAGGWDNEFDPARHVRPLDRPADEPADQTFATPLDVLARPDAFARVYLLAADGTRQRFLERLNSSYLYTHAVGPFTAS